MWRSGGTKPEAASPQTRSRFRGPYRVLLSLAVVFVTVVFLFPIIFKPGVEPPAELQFGSPSSVAVQISNQNVTPLTDVEYSCVLSKLTLANGSAVMDAKVFVRGAIPKIPGRQAIRAHCETAYIVAAPLKAAEYTLTLTYREYPWLRHRTSVYRIAAQLNGAGQVAGWKLN